MHTVEWCASVSPKVKTCRRSYRAIPATPTLPAPTPLRTPPPEAALDLISTRLRPDSDLKRGNFESELRPDWLCWPCGSSEGHSSAGCEHGHWWRCRCVWRWLQGMRNFDRHYHPDLRGGCFVRSLDTNVASLLGLIMSNSG